MTKGKKAKINTDLTDALSASGITNPAFVKAARALLEPRVAMDTDEASMDIGLGPMGIAEAVKRWAAGDEGKSFVASAKGDNARATTADTSNSRLRAISGAIPRREPRPSQPSSPSLRPSAS